ncbi:unnamed protein product [Adineta steineri]|uniref:Uncharacterized protein n=1 Tax=Adineta steineri TaxID=433720 RepID=A0A814DHB0_9BILA|nr:unnamed protein product [Adineta steineri]CAF1554200.1 unnamed protein product [Adineta steineri]
MELLRKLGQYLKNLNIFQSVPPSTDEHNLQNERISTRLFIFLFVLALVILLVYNSLITSIKTDNFETPTFKEYEELYKSYSATITCPCKNILIDYKEILRIDYTIHQVCSSAFVTQDWISFLIHSDNRTKPFNTKFRSEGRTTFHALNSFCTLVNQTIDDNLEQFYLNQYVSIIVTPENLFVSQIETFVNQFRLSITSNFHISLNMIRNTTQNNGLYPGSTQTYYIRVAAGTTQSTPILFKYSNCSCDISSRCIETYGMYIYASSPSSPPVWTVPDFYRGCYITEALLQSSLQCFYNQSCINKTQSFLSSSSMNITALNSSLSSEYFVNSTIEELLKKLMIENWNLSKKYENYYNECEPIECNYIHEIRHSIVYILTALVSLAGGLTTALKIVVPILVKFVRRKKQPQTSANGAQVNERVTPLIQKLKTYFKMLNMFQSVPPSTDEHNLQNERISTKLFIFLFGLVLVILLVYNSLITSIKTSIVKTPTFKEYEELYKPYSITITCPCKNILIDYKEILRIDYTIHQVCNSIFVTQDWIKYLTHPSEHDQRRIINEDLRMSGRNAFRALNSFCQLISQTLDDNLKQFYLNQYVSTTVTPKNLFVSQIDIFVNQFRSLITSNFHISLNMIRNTTQNNGLYSALATNYNLYAVSINGNLLPPSIDYGDCSCDNTSRCVIEYGIYNYTTKTPLLSVPNFYRGCYITEALLQSSLQCFYDQSCINQIQLFLPSPSKNITALNPLLSSEYFVNSTIEELLKKLMIENWNLSKKYENYYNECEPVECNYIHEPRHGIVYIITALVGLVGGLITALKIVVPILVKFVRRKKQLQTSTNELSIKQRILALWHKIPHFIRTFNLFSSIPPSVDEHDLRNQRISTRLFIFLFVLALLILLVYNSLITSIKTDDFKTPTFEKYEELYKPYSATITCPCKNILIDYKEILHIDYTLHQVCNSIFVTQYWINYLAHSYKDDQRIHHYDFRLIGKFAFQALDEFCKLVNQTLDESLKQFYLNQYVSTTVIHENLFKSQVEIFVNQFRSSITSKFHISLDMIRNTIRMNGLYSALSRNYYFRRTEHSGDSISLTSYVYSNCSCDFPATCTWEYGIYNYPSTIPVLSVPNFYRGCYIIEALLQSSLQCFFNQSCINTTQSFLPSSSMNITALNPLLSSKYSVNSTIEELLKKLMIENWNFSTKYKNYYNECEPIECSYIYETRHGVVYILTALFGLAGGLTTALKIIVPRLVKFSLYILKKCSRRIDPQIETDQT